MKIAVFLLLFSTSLRAAQLLPFSRELQIPALRYFLENTNPKTGLVRDRARNFGPTPDDGGYEMASIAATGFGMAVLANACTQDLLDCAWAKKSITSTLRFAWSNLEEHDGWLYHFVNWKTGRRFGKSEVSTIDTTWFLAGAIYAAQVFPNSQISRLSDALYRRLDFIAMMTNDDSSPYKRTLSMGWVPESGFLSANWDSYAEQMLLILLGIGHPTHPLPLETWRAWKRPQEILVDGSVLLGAQLPLFAHQYSFLFLDLRNWQDGTNYFNNSEIATRRDHTFCKQHPEFPTYREGFWGLSASDSAHGYSAFSVENQDGTVCPNCAGASIIFAPRLVLASLASWRNGPFAKRIWGRYGFVDSLNVDRGWFDPDVIGITVGALYLALADLSENSPWKLLKNFDPLNRALNVLGRESLPEVSSEKNRSYRCRPDSESCP